MTSTREILRGQCILQQDDQETVLVSSVHDAPNGGSGGVWGRHEAKEMVVDALLIESCCDIMCRVHVYAIGCWSDRCDG